LRPGAVTERRQEPTLWPPRAPAWTAPRSLGDERMPGHASAPLAPGSAAPVAPSPATRRDWFTAMVRIRTFEDKVQELFMSGQIGGTTHLCQGQEAVSVGAIAA